MKIASEIKFGIIAGLSLCLWVLLEFYFGFHTSRFELAEYSEYFSNIVPFVFIYICFYKKYVAQKSRVFTYKKGLLSGLKISTVMSIITTAFMAAYYKYINPNFWERLLMWEAQRMRHNLIPKPEIAERIEEFKLLNSNIGLALELVTTIVTGTMLSLVVSLLIKQKLKRNWQVNIS